MDLVTGATGSLLAKLGELLKEELVKQVKERLGEQVTEEFKLQMDLREQVQSLLGELEYMHTFLCMVAEVPREQLTSLDKLWARDIKELSYDMEDIVDTFLVRVEDGHEATPDPHRMHSFMEKLGNLFSQVPARYQIAHTIKKIKDQVQEVANKRSRYTIDSIVATPATSTPIDPRLQALYREATELVGIDGKRDQELIKLLSEGDDVSNKKLKIVSVVGFGGLGKTTLVKAVCDKINGDFDSWAFVSVGQNPDLKKVFKEILLELNCTDPNLMALVERQLIDKLRKFLKNKRYLIIIDDIWDEKHWKYIKLAFPNGNNLDSRLITTTRILSVSKACCSSSDDMVYEMKPLSDDDSQRLFYRRIFSDRSECPPELEQVSRDILKKCGGVPLAIITIASLLASHNQTKDEWYTVLNSIGRGLTEHAYAEEMQRILSFSYYDLPSQLKTCLLYLSIFPEDYKIDRDGLIWRWIAEDFFQCENQQTSLFKFGESCFNELINRSMIQPEDINWEGSARACRVHDMVRDLICSLSSEENFVTILDGTEQSTSNSQSKVRRLSLQNSKVDETTPIVSVSTTPLVPVSQVRSFIIFRRAINLMQPLSSFHVLRVLDLEGCNFEESSRLNLRDVGNLFQLRYLGLARTYIRELPEEIGKLQFLQVLDVRGNYGLMELPSTVVKLRRLMCLLLDQFTKRLPDGMGNLTSMEVLHNGCPNIVKELHNLTRLRELKIYFGENESSEELEEAFVESLCNLHNIQILVISGSFRSMDLLGERWVPPRHLRTFHSDIWNEVNAFSTLAAWDPSHLSYLSELSIHVKELRQEDLQLLGRLPALCSLEILSGPQTQRLLHVGADLFRSLVCFTLNLWKNVTGHLMFQEGALPRAQEVKFHFDVRIAKDDGNGVLDSGLGNLRSLRHIIVAIHRDGANATEVEEAEVALRHAVDVHPNHPTILIYFEPESDDDDYMDASSGDLSPESDDDGMDVSSGEESPASGGHGDEDAPENLVN